MNNIFIEGKLFPSFLFFVLTNRLERGNIKPSKGKNGFNSYGAYENPYLSFDAFILQELLTGTALGAAWADDVA